MKSLKAEKFYSSSVSVVKRTYSRQKTIGYHSKVSKIARLETLYSSFVLTKRVQEQSTRSHEHEKKFVRQTIRIFVNASRSIKENCVTYRDDKPQTITPFKAELQGERLQVSITVTNFW